MSIPTQGTISTASPTGRFEGFSRAPTLTSPALPPAEVRELSARLPGEKSRGWAEESLGYLRYLEKNMQQEMI